MRVLGSQIHAKATLSRVLSHLYVVVTHKSLSKLTYSAFYFTILCVLHRRFSGTRSHFFVARKVGYEHDEEKIIWTKSFGLEGFIQ